MKLYEFTGAPNPRRVRIFLAEKGIKVPFEQIDIAKRTKSLARVPQDQPDGRAAGTGARRRNRARRIGRHLPLLRGNPKPEPRLMGIDAKDIALVEMWNRRMEFEILSMTAGAFRNTNAFFKGRIPQVPEYGEICKNAALKRLEWLDSRVSKSPLHRGRSLHDCGHHRDGRDRLRPADQHSHPARTAKESRALARVGFQPAKRKGLISESADWACTAGRASGTR